MNQAPWDNRSQVDLDRDIGREVATIREKPIHTPLQIIAHAVTRLSWVDAERMGEAIRAKQGDGKSLTAAIQAWATEWEGFE